MERSIFDFSAECRKAYGDDVLADGILNPELYWNSKPRILWLLRETWYRNSWDDLKRPNVYARMGRSPTWHVMTYVTYSLQNGFPAWRDMYYIREDPDMAECLRTIAYVNVNKRCGDTYSDPNEIDRCFCRAESLLRHQIEEARPQVILGCAPYLERVMLWYHLEPRESETVRYAAREDAPLLLQVDHPSQFRRTREAYVDEIVGLAKRALREQAFA